MSLANIYASLCDKYSEKYSVTYLAPPTYLKNIVGLEEVCKDKIIFFCKEDRRSVTKPTKAVPLGSGKNDSHTDMDLTGSPLKDDCEVEMIENGSIDLDLNVRNAWKPEEEYHKGLPVETARTIICSQDFQSGADRVHGSVWFLCDGTTDEKVLFLQYEFETGYFSRGIVTFVGITPVSTIQLVQPLLQKHFIAIRTDTPFETNVENVYQLKSDIMISCAWSTTAKAPVLIDLTSCDVTLSHTFRLNDCSLLTQDLMNQLRILQCIREDIISYKDSGNAAIEPLYRCGRGIELDDLRESINKLMTEITGFLEVEPSNEIERDIEAFVNMSKTRRLTDLTDMLWDLLKRCSSYNDLKAAFHILFQCAARCNLVNTPTNKNRLAEIIAEVSNRRVAIPCLKGSEPLELLLEIGLEKLYKDYEFIFTESKICSPNSLKGTNTLNVGDEENGGNGLSSVRKSLRNAIQATTPRKTLLHNNKANIDKQLSGAVVGFQNSNFDEDASAIQLAKLLQIHCTLEHVLSIQNQLNLHNVYSDICEQLLSKPIKPLVACIDESFVDQMDISMLAHNVREHLEGKDPFSRRITFKSKNKFRHVKTTFFYCTDNICPPGISNGFQSDDKIVCKENLYYTWLYQKIQTRK